MKTLGIVYDYIDTNILKYLKALDKVSGEDVNIIHGSKLNTITLKSDAVLVMKPTKQDLTSIPPHKDIDNVTGNGLQEPCTAQAVREVLSTKDVEGKYVVIIGRHLGKYIFDVCNDFNMTITICNSYTKDVNRYTKDADVVISTAGVPNLVTQYRENALLIDIGLGDIVGDNKLYLSKRTTEILIERLNSMNSSLEIVSNNI